MYASTAFLMLQWRSGSLQKMLCGFPVLHHPNCQPFSQSPPSSLLAILALYIVALKYLITVHIGKLHFIWLAKKDNLMLSNDQFKAISINVNAQHVNGMTPFDVKLGQASIFLGQDLKKVGSGQQNGT